MEMSAKYLLETAEVLATKGFQLTTETWSHPTSDAGPATAGTRYRLNRGNLEELVLEVAHADSYPDRYFLELVQYHGLKSYSFPLDSWKHFPNRVEFKFYTMPESGLGLSFSLDLSEGPNPA